MYVNRFLHRSFFVCSLFAAVSLTHASTNLLNASDGSTVEYRMDASGAVVAAGAAGAATAGAAALHYGSSALSSDSVSFYKRYNLRLVDSYGNAAKTTLSTTTKYARPLFVAAATAAVVNAGSAAFDKNKEQFSGSWRNGDYQTAFNAFMTGILETTKDAANDLTFGASGYVGQSINDYLNFDPKSPLDAYALAQAAKMKAAIDKAGSNKDYSNVQKVAIVELYTGNSSPRPKTGEIYIPIDKDDSIVTCFGTFPPSSTCTSSRGVVLWKGDGETGIWVREATVNNDNRNQIINALKAQDAAKAQQDIKLTEPEAKEAVQKYIDANLGNDDFRKSLGAYIGDSSGYDTKLGVDNTTVDDAPKTVATSPFTPANGTKAQQYVFEIAPDGTVRAKPVDRPDVVAGSAAAPVRNSTVNNYTNVNNPAAPATPETPDVCALHPDSVGCMPVGNADYEDVDIPTVENSFVFSPVNAFQNSGTCPQPYAVTISGKQYLIKYDQICDFANGLRPIIIACGVFIAAAMCAAAIREV